MATDKLTQVIESSIEEIAEDFQQCAMNYVQEADLQAGLFRLLRNDTSMSIRSEGYTVELVHAEWPVIRKAPSKQSRYKIDGAYDLVVWKRDTAKKPECYWGIGSSKRAGHMRLHSVIEIKHRRADMTTAWEWATEDMEKLKHSLKTRRAQHAYHLVFVDNDEEVKNKNKFDSLRKTLKQMRGGYRNLEIVLVARTQNGDIWL